jgi:hypothetical protein
MTARRGWLLRTLGACLYLEACATTANAPPGAAMSAAATSAPSMRFADDLAFLRQHTELVLLQSRDARAQVIVAPEYQGRVMTSTARAGDGASFGFIQRAVIAEKRRVPHINVFGGEDRFWLGPEGGQFGLYFAPGAAFDLEHWQVPEAIDWGAWNVTARTTSEVRLERDMQLQNSAGTAFELHVDRQVRVLERDALASALGMQVPSALDVVGYESQNSIRNTGHAAWSKEQGLLSIWILGMYNPSPHTTVVIPFRAGSEAELGPIVNDAYFGKVPTDRLVIGDGVVFFRGDGAQRGKLGVSRSRALPIVGAYDAAEHVLTLVQYTLPQDATDYVNSMWTQQAHPYAGDVVNSYNDGPPEPGKPPLGPFYELETSSPAAALAPGETLTHVHRTVHITGARAGLDAIATRLLGVDLARIEHAFAR